MSFPRPGTPTGEALPSQPVLPSPPAPPPEKHVTLPLRDRGRGVDPRGCYHASLDRSSAPPSLQPPRKVLPRYRRPADLSKGSQGCSQPELTDGLPQNTEARMSPRRVWVPVRRREERACGDAAITHALGHPGASRCPSPSPAAGRRHLPSPPPVRGGTLPTRHFRRAGGAGRVWCC